MEDWAQSFDVCLWSCRLREWYIWLVGDCFNDSDIWSILCLTFIGMYFSPKIVEILICHYLQINHFLLQLNRATGNSQLMETKIRSINVYSTIMVHSFSPSMQFPLLTRTSCLVASWSFVMWLLVWLRRQEGITDYLVALSERRMRMERRVKR